MFMLKIIAAITALFGIYLVTRWFDNLSERESGYRFFTGESFGWYGASYVLMYAGYRMIETSWHGDPINGSIILIIGLAVFAVPVRDNFRRTRPLLAIAGSLLQTLIYAPLTVVGIIALVIAIAAASGIKPVYCVNGD